MIEEIYLREYAQELDINEDRYNWIVDHAACAIRVFFAAGGNVDVNSTDCKIDIFTRTLMKNCVGENECQFFCYAVKLLLVGGHDVDEASASNIASSIWQQCVQIAQTRMLTAQVRTPSRGGCFNLIGFIAMVPLGYCAARFILA